MARSMLRTAFLAILATAHPALAAEPVTAVVTPYQPEWEAMLPLLSGRKDENAGGVHFVSGTVAGAPVLVVESGIGPVNAALATQIAIDRFAARRVMVVGIAGGVDPQLHVGDVVVPERWSDYLFSVFARATRSGYTLPGFAPNKTEHYDMIFPQPVPVGHAPAAPVEQRWLAVDSDLLAVARAAAKTVKLDRCRSADQCLRAAPQVVVGGQGVSGPAFVDNASFRQFVDKDFRASAVDMESAAVAEVATSNQISFIAIRSLSDLAGGEADGNEMKVFESLAARNATAIFRQFMQDLHDRDGAR